MKNPINLPENVWVDGDPGEEIVGLEVVIESKGCQIAPFGVVTKEISYQDVFVSTRVEFLNDRAADEAGGSGDESAGTSIG